MLTTAGTAAAAIALAVESLRTEERAAMRRALSFTSGEVGFGAAAAAYQSAIAARRDAERRYTAACKAAGLPW